MAEKKVIMNMSGDEFKQLIEGENPNGQIDTFKEVKRALQGYSDDGSIKEQNEADYATNEDIDEIFSDDNR